jgi:predicted RND superfamily exporter protein
MARKLYLLRRSRLGETEGWALSIDGFIRFINEEVRTDPDLKDNIDEDDADMLDAAERLTAAVIAGGTFDYQAMAGLFDGFSDEMDENNLRLMYIYYFSRIASDPAWTFSILELFDYLTGEILNDPLFEDMFDDEIRETLLDTKADLDEGVLQLTGPNFSRMVITTTYPGESAETYAFLGGLIQDFSEDLQGSYYIVGDSPMHYEMSQSFGGELTLITWLTIVSIFIVVALTFRSVAIPALLVVIIQCGVYMTVSTIGFQGYSIYFLAFLIVECILMGSTIDYGILFTNYYVEKRKLMGPKEALAAAYEGSLHTILTSGSIMILAAGVVGRFFGNETVRQICETISKGAICACLLIVFILPGILALCDRFVVKHT